MSSSDTSASSGVERFAYDDAIVRKFAFATVLWGFVGMLVGVIIALQLAEPWFNRFGLEAGWLKILSFGRLRPLHTNAVIFAFSGNAIFTGCYYSSQRLLKTRMFSDALSRIHFWGWQAIIVAAAITLPLGFTQGREYAELEWPIDIAIALVWVVFAINFFGTMAKRREKHLYVAIWFFVASILAVAVLHIFNNIWVVAGPMKSYSVYAGVQDAFMQWWYGHNAVAFFLTTPFLGLMYYFLPKAANRPVFSYRLSIIHFWSLVFIYLWAGPHHLHYTALPEWASTLGMLFSIMLWMPSWGGMLNGLLTLRGAWDRVAKDPVLKFFVVGVTFYGMSTFEGPLLSIKAVNSLSHYTDWTIAHVHAGALGWNGFITFGMLYWLAPRLFQTKGMAKPKWAELHFWLGTIGILLYIIAIYGAGLTQGLMWRDFNPDGTLAYPDFMETVSILIPMYWVRVIGGTLYLAGVVLSLFNFVMTWKMRPAKYAESMGEAPPLVLDKTPMPAEHKPVTPLFWGGIALTGVAGAAALVPGITDSDTISSLLTLVAGIGLTVMTLEIFGRLQWHRWLEARAMRFTIWVTLSIAAASLFEIIPLFAIEANVPTIASVKPYTPLELYGRDIYLEEGCYNCHSQMVRPLRFETERFGEYSKAGEFVYDHPFQWGSRRIGPDLHREGVLKPSALWHLRHMNNPRDTSSDSIMPAYPHLLTEDTPYSVIPTRIRAMAFLGVPYDDVKEGDLSIVAAKVQAQLIEKEMGADGAGLADKKITAMIAYLKRLGTDI
ncbi:MAG: cytochrome-c oxidase, cbb3-type subunit I [Planctomycetes bacterium]|jgi:cytochrome c oxidase cbb3-type subunit I/II|nr:cytochrome-c oxidase, cbb3-type subunit I [Planctomycetota bacterium]MBT4559774.1 cytochrome-c oxidase, cbb3-type subunit I [Planctomycetota bacterium]MBT5119605.1 cytochrome-c oxidase, cbb3-type subunit I [Planctomycetota bacterium]MBT7011970.1 cytochrome-c oxidase, cbb3-type subunit I [Planctomycetota bacterium]MBT7319235.1 cytochrome-c oxidase, cbb3-type subunit I [Planctomycetota bacterium]